MEVLVDGLGHSEFAVKVLSAIAGALSVPLIYVLSQKLFSNRYVSVFTAALLLISPMAIEYSQEGRGYIASASGNVYVVIEQEYDPYTLLTESTSPNCQKIHEGYWITVWKITGPIA